MKRKIKKILIANRGEIAVRIQRTIRELGITSVAIYSNEDKHAPFVLNSDEAYPLDGSTAKETYLNIKKILKIAVSSSCDAIHPGYGFLSENPEFAMAVEQAHKIFIGPPGRVIKKMGSKTSARQLMSEVKVPIIPGSLNSIISYEDVAYAASKTGFPLLIKATDGGGGKGMRKVDSLSDLKSGFERAQAEAQSAFGSNRVYIEKFLATPRHVEVQILADIHGNIVYLGERECSVQRRHQKVIEESPSSIVTPELRAQLGEAAVKVAKACGYANAGTVEFLLDSDCQFYFLEMNTRLQVEHPVTELVYGIDLVKSQIQIAEGEALSVKQAEIAPRGHAIECRLYAEDPGNNFFPSTGTITHYQPSEGYGIRNDSGICNGFVVSHFFDPLLAKLIVWGKDRGEAIARMKRALREYTIGGVATTIPFCNFVMNHENFVQGNFDIGFVERHYNSALSSRSTSEDENNILAASLASAFVEMNNVVSNSLKQNNVNRWKLKRFEED
ncbi:MAG: acetyl-CoA carboxylase biotin carboxylase subunit [Bacteroidota bacterium]|nr:acetyl-CoA carboxylase biotin carboxylase subunit [Bacteroidota bacterium]